MALYRYEATDKTGKVVRGVMNAGDEAQVTHNLAAMGYTPRGVYGAGAGHTSASAQPASSARSVSSPRSSGAVSSLTVGSGVPVSIASKVPVRQLAAFFRQLVSLVKSGIPLAQSFHDLAPYTRNGKLRDAIPRMQEVMQSGQPLSTAMAAFPDLFPAHAIASVWCGELSGDLDVILGEVASDIEQEASDSSFARIGYWIVNGSFLATVIAAPLFSVGDMIAPVLSDDPSEYAHSQALVPYFLSRSLDRFLHFGLPVLAVLIALSIGWRHVKRVPTVRFMMDRFLLGVPGWGKFHRYRSLGRFLHLLDGLYSAGIAPGRAWDAACVATRNSFIADQLKQARSQTSATPGMSEMAAAAGVLQPEDVGLISTGEKTGDLPSMLSRLATVYGEQAARQKSICRVLSISAMNCALLGLGGVGLIMISKSYIDPIAKFLGM